MKELTIKINETIEKFTREAHLSLSDIATALNSVLYHILWLQFKKMDSEE